MLSIGMGEIVIILLVGLVIFGPEKLPELARSAGRGLAAFQQTFEGIQEEIDQGMKEARDAAEVDMPSMNVSESQKSQPDPDSDDESQDEGDENEHESDREDGPRETESG